MHTDPEKSSLYKAMHERQLVVTDDGSHTLLLPELNEHYHSTFGAVNESRHVFVDAGFRQALSRFSHIRLLEVGFGTGLNALLTFITAEELGAGVDYLGVEPFPLDETWLPRFNYTGVIGTPSCLQWWHFIHHTSPWMVRTRSPGNSSLLKWKGFIEELPGSEGPFNLVYFDAFAPAVQPELWDEAIFTRLAGMMDHGGMLVTYSSKGNVRRALKGAGLRVEKLPGPVGKREMVRAELI